VPQAPRRPCTWPGCGVLVTASSRCAAHQIQAKREADSRRGSSSERGYGGKWRRAREAFLSRHPLCECPECGAGAIRALAATIVDHIVPHRGDAKLFWNQKNWQAMAKPCHDAKTAREDGGFGNPSQQ
jgi:5-methylcytosine-specific restriction protein A